MTSPVPDPDGRELVALVARARDGDVDGFARLVELYQRPLLRYCVRMLHDRGDAEDVLQDTLVRVWRQLPTLSDPQAFVAWLYRIATRACLNQIRTRERRPSTPVAAEQLEAHADASDPAGSVELTAQLRRLDQLVVELPQELRVCWLLAEQQGLSYREVARVVELSESTVRGRIARARGRLAEGMAPWR